MCTCVKIVIKIWFLVLPLIKLFCPWNAFQRESIPTNVEVSLITEKNWTTNGKEMEQKLYFWRNNGDIYKIPTFGISLEVFVSWQVFKSRCFNNHFYTSKPLLRKFWLHWYWFFHLLFPYWNILWNFCSKRFFKWNSFLWGMMPEEYQRVINILKKDNYCSETLLSN